jgi:integrase
VFSLAVKDELLVRNPMVSVEKPTGQRTETRILTAKDARKLLEAAAGSRLYPLVATALATAMRQGELFALQWENVHLDAGYLLVKATLTEAADRSLVFSEPKTQAGRRRVDLDGEIIGILRTWRKGQIASGYLGSLVFPSASGPRSIDKGPASGARRKSNFVRREWAPLLKKAEIPRITFHGLRHTGNSLLASQGVGIKTLQARLGHATLKTTLDTYTHLLPGDQQKAADMIGKMLFGANPGASAEIDRDV